MSKDELVILLTDWNGSATHLKMRLSFRYPHASPMVAPIDSEVPRMVMDRAPCESKYLPEKMDPAKVKNDCSVPIHLRSDMSSNMELSG